MDGQRYRAVLFDLDGTLVDSYAALTTAVNRARATQRLDGLTTSDIRGLVGEGMERLLQKALETTTIPVTALDEFVRSYDEVCCEQSQLLDGVVSTIHRLHENRIAMAVCTNKPTGFSTKIVEHLGLAPFFVAVVGPDAAGAQKPDARHVLHTLASVACEPHEALFVGDMPIDILAARNSGVDVAVIATGSATKEQLVAENPDYVLESFSDLVDIVCAVALRETHS
ncbi:MAG TPA: HAD-IA family hydrolase [Thermoanaerobaculia bacterium]